MAKEKPESVFEVNKIRELIELMRENDLGEIDLKQADQRIRLRKGGIDQPVMYASPAAMPQTAAAPAGLPPATPESNDPVEEGNFAFIESPTIGTFYSKPKPDTDDFVKVGDSVSPDTVVCIVEAMKMFNEITAGVSGKIVEVLVKNEDPVDNNKPLFKVAID